MSEDTYYNVFRLLGKISHGMGLWHEDDWGTEYSNILKSLLDSVHKARDSDALLERAKAILVDSQTRSNDWEQQAEELIAQLNNRKSL